MRLNMTIQIYNTLTRAKQPLETVEPGVVRMYVCGVTVYDNAHIGHAMSALVFDIIRRYLEYRGYAFALLFNSTVLKNKLSTPAKHLGATRRNWPSRMWPSSSRSCRRSI